MTLKEKVAEMEPDAINQREPGGVMNCPGDYEYLNDRKSWGNCVLSCPTQQECNDCWNREFVPKEGEETKTKLDKAIEEVAYILDCLTAYRSITEKGCCNDCKFKRGCKCCPKPGEVVRYNCPLYEREV
jgi:hypothetical protein